MQESKFRKYGLRSGSPFNKNICYSMYRNSFWERLKFVLISNEIWYSGKKLFFSLEWNFFGGYKHSIHTKFLRVIFSYGTHNFVKTIEDNRFKLKVTPSKIPLQLHFSTKTWLDSPLRARAISAWQKANNNRSNKNNNKQREYNENHPTNWTKRNSTTTSNN